MRESACEINRERLHEREYKLGCNLKLETFFFKRNREDGAARRHPRLAVTSSETSAQRHHQEKQSSSFVFFSPKDLNAHKQTNSLTQLQKYAHEHTYTHANKQISIAETTISSKGSLD
uniref:(northern house mosquito) hypothetical protein n=1 Tax=Culex pipiens TaxID=7175 RepID=A0A8D8C2M0_CULPI